MKYKTLDEASSFDRAAISVVAINLESKISANIINTFRNVFPAVRNYVSDVILEYKAYDETDFNFQKASAHFLELESSIADINFVKLGQTLVQVPEGFTDRYVPYLEWMTKYGISFINNTHSILEAYYRELSLFISSKEGKLNTKDTTRMYADMEKSLTETKSGLGSFFDSRTSNALRPLDEVFDRGSDIKNAMKLAKELNRNRLAIRSKEIMGITTRIAELINMLVESSESEKIPEVSGPAATSIAQGAMVAARYVEFVGVLRYRIEELLAATGIMSEQVSNSIKSKT